MPTHSKIERLYNQALAAASKSQKAPPGTDKAPNSKNLIHREYIERKISEDISTKVVMDMIMSLPSGTRPRIGNKLIYMSMYRPLVAPNKLTTKAEGIEIFEIDRNTRGLVLTTKPLDPGIIEEWELTPVGKAAAWALMSVTKIPIELAESKPHGPRTRAILIHKGTKNEPRLTFFEEEIGPTGHQEADEYIELIHIALNMGYRRISRGIIDNIMATVEG
jgi:hypothetical protein